MLTANICIQSIGREPTPHHLKGQPMAVQDWSTTPASNTFLEAINLSEGTMTVANVNNAFRQMMADIRVFYNGVPATATLMPKEGGVFEGTEPTYNSRGAYLHWSTAGLSSGRVYLQASGGGIPSGALPGSLILEY
jgi:hypothetical protein